MTIKLKKLANSTKSAHHSVAIDGLVVGEIWREKALVVVSKLTAPRRSAVRDRWFARVAGDLKIIGRGTRAAMLLGAGFKSKDEAIAALQSHRLNCQISSEKAPATGYFVDWDGKARRVEKPGAGYSCGPVRTATIDGQDVQCVDVLDSDGCVVHEAVVYASLEAVQDACGAPVDLAVA